jgi:hypothetical protein
VKQNSNYGLVVFCTAFAAAVADEAEPDQVTDLEVLHVSAQVCDAT